MNRHVFVTLAAVLGVVVQGVPQHRFQPYQISFTAGKHTSSVPLGVGSAVSNDPVIPAETAPLSPIAEPALVQEPASISEIPTASEPAPSEDFQFIWEQAAKNLVSIPHLLQWVSSLKAETLVADLMRQQQGAASSQPQYAEPVLGEPAPVPQEDSTYSQVQSEEPAIVEVQQPTEIYEGEITTTENYIIEETTAQAEPIIAELSTVEPMPQAVREDFTPVQPTVIEQEPIELIPEVAQPEPVADVSYTEPEPVSEVNYREPEPFTRTHHTSRRPVTKANTQRDPQVQRGFSWEPQIIPTYEKAAPIPKKKTTFKFSHNRINSRNHSPNKGKTLFSFEPLAAAPVPSSSFSSDPFAFPAYSYSINHQPTSFSFPGRR